MKKISNNLFKQKANYKSIILNKLTHINISKGGVPKLLIVEASVNEMGIEGDEQSNKKYHGGIDRAICIFSKQMIEKLQVEGHPIFAGSTGENLTLDFADFHKLVPGNRLKIGNNLVIEITSYTAPCKTIAKSFMNGKFTRISQKVNPQESRLYAKVIKEGCIKIGDKIQMY